ncbi:MAG: hypothetical protein SH817_13310 [Leptospira sp.]|nr:hypothetical protein [Leptospira sp.]
MKNISVFCIFLLIGCLSEKDDCYDKLEINSSDTNCLVLPIALRNTEIRSTGLADIIFNEMPSV